MPASSFHDVDASALRCLRELALADRGYEHRGVRGWALREDVERLTRGPMPERLPILHKRGLLDRADVRPPGLGKPIWMFRINDTGAEIAACGRGEPLVPVPSPGPEQDPPIYVPPASRRALEMLRAAWADPHARSIDGEGGGWRTMAELLDRATPENASGGYEPDSRGWDGDSQEWEEFPAREPWRGDGWRPDLAAWGTESERDSWGGGMPSRNEERFGWDDVQWLIKAHLAEVRRIVHPFRRRAVGLYRVTLVGLSIRLLTWIDGDATGRSGGVHD